jgi:CxxC-x17-CxxC domain-containing protein
MHDVICDKCKIKCQVPFKPTGDKPVYCSDCFRSNSGRDESSRGGFRSRSPSQYGAPQSGQSGASQSGISQEQFKQLNEKLDKILEFIGGLEMVASDSEEDSDEDADDK